MKQAPPARRRYAKTTERRSAIAKAALELVLEKGHRALTTAEVALRASMSETAMLYHFPTRDHILVAAMELADQERRSVLTGEFTASEAKGNKWPPPGIARITQEQEATIRLFLALGAEAVNPEHPAHAYLKDHNERAVQDFAAGVKRRQADGTAIPGLDPYAVARQMLAVWSGLRSQWLINPSFSLDLEVAQAFRALNGQPLMDAKRQIDEVLSQNWP
jgi:AcrR family transcriptional regulator